MDEREFPPPPPPLSAEGNFNVARYEEEQQIDDSVPVPLVSVQKETDEGKMDKIKGFFNKAKKPKLPKMPFFKKKKQDNVLQLDVIPQENLNESEPEPMPQQSQRLTPPEQDSWSPGQPLLQRGASVDARGAEEGQNFPQPVIINRPEEAPLDTGFAAEGEQTRAPFREITRKRVRASTVTLALLLLGLAVGIVLTALSSRSFMLKIIGPTLIGLSFFALIGKIYFTLFLGDNPDLGLQPIVKKAQKMIKRKESSN
ncbi:DgyrCDS9179 [Dimorphilus gyrociliatus]|uniref:DgyrCDS9179 n=1 Tax=Dimorphilus gyrociliatus TaxID=2664684 RepID=A0A7I8VWA5_9ANNE|nr:DgyrCDS9179 [Dimorphilus gyrociliatus]